MRFCYDFCYLGKESFRAAEYEKRGFTLVELLVTITILAILIVVVVVLIDPGEIFMRTRDTRRMADLATLRSAITFSIATGEEIDFDGSNILTCSDETSPSAYVSIPATTTMHSAPTGWTWKQAAKTKLSNIDGTGWVPIDFTQASGGSPLFNLPIDPRNEDAGAARYFYSFGCKRFNRKFELNARLESQTVGPGGKDDKSANDGGDTATVYELGSAPNILPTSGVY